MSAPLLSTPYKVPQKCLDLVNQIFEIEKKVAALTETNSISRNVNKVKEMLETSYCNHGGGFVYENPLGEKYSETRTDCEASIAGIATDNLEIVEVIKPVIFLKHGDIKQMVQKAVVVAQAKK